MMNITLENIFSHFNALYLAVTDSPLGSLQGWRKENVEIFSEKLQIASACAQLRPCVQGHKLHLGLYQPIGISFHCPVFDIQQHHASKRAQLARDQ